MKIVLNGDLREIQAVRLSEVLSELGFGQAKVATALNEAFIPAGRRADIQLKDGDRLEVVAPMQGG